MQRNNYGDPLAQVNEFVCIDINPGGYTTPTGELGIAEVCDDQITENFQFQFISPYYKTPEDQNANNAPNFDEIWPYIDAFVSERTVVAYNAGYDRSVLQKILNTLDIPPRRGLLYVL